MKAIEGVRQLLLRVKEEILHILFLELVFRIGKIQRLNLSGKVVIVSSFATVERFVFGKFIIFRASNKKQITSLF